MMQVFDKGVQIRMGQAHVKGWIPSPCRSSATTSIRSERKTWRPTSSAREEPYVYENLPEKEDSAIKILLRRDASRILVAPLVRRPSRGCGEIAVGAAEDASLRPPGA